MNSAGIRGPLEAYLREMKPPAVMLASGLAFLLLINLLLQGSGLWYWFPVQHGDSVKLYALAAEKRNYDVVIIGSSASARDLIPGVMEEELDRRLPRSEPWLIYDASVSAGDFPAFVDISRRILDHGQKPKVVVLMFLPFNLNSNRAAGEMQIKLFTAGAGDFFTLMRHGNNHSRLAAVSSLTHGINVLLQSPLLFKDRHLVQRQQDRHGSTYTYPFTPEAVIENQRMLPSDKVSLAEVEQEKVRNIRKINLENFEIGPLIDAWMSELIGRLKANDVRVVVTMAPEASWFIPAAYGDERERSARYLAEFAVREGLIFQDLSQPPFLPNRAEFFDGCDHLGPEGAARLSRQLTDLILVPALSGGVR